VDPGKNIAPQNKIPHIIDSSTTVVSEIYPEVEKRIQQAADEMRALESTPVIADFARQYVGT